MKTRSADLRFLKVGDVITADLLNAITTAVQANQGAIKSPTQKDIATGSSGGGNLDFTETSRTQTTVTVTDSGGATHDIEQIDQVVLENSSGDVMTLNFTNP